jgi:hypothetical protein
MQGKRKSSKKKREEKYLEPCRQSRDDLWPDNLDFHRIVLQDANLGGVLLVLFQEFGLDPVAHGGRVDVSGLGLRLLCGASSGAGGGGTSLAHSGGAQPRTHWEWEQCCEARAVREVEDDDSGGVG